MVEHKHDISFDSAVHEKDDLSTPTEESDRGGNEQCAGYHGTITDMERCENEATVGLKIHSYLGYGHYGWIHARFCDECADAPQVINSAPMNYDGVAGEIDDFS